MLDNLQLLFGEPLVGVDLVVNGLMIGSIFALIAFGLALVWGVMNIINVCQGEFVMLGGFVTVTLAGLGLPPLAALPVAAVVLYGIGWLCYRLVVHRVVGHDLFNSVLATFGLSILLQQASNQLFGADIRTADPGLPTLVLFDGAVSVGWIKLTAFILALTLGAVVWLFLRYARLGQAIRATAQNARAARILGIDVQAVYARTYALNAALCGAGGALVVMAWAIHPYIGLPYTVRSFMVVITAGLGNFAGVLLAGLGLGALENIAGFVIGVEYQVGFVFLLMVAILVWRNHRLAAQRQVLR